MKEGIRKNIFIGIVLLLALLLIALVIRIYDARIRNIEKRQKEGYMDWKSRQGAGDSPEGESHPNLGSFL